MNRFVTIVALALFSAPVVRADMGPFLPGTRYATATYELSTREYLRDYIVVVVRDDWRRGRDEAEFLALVVGSPVSLTTAYRDEPELLIVSKQHGERYATAGELAAAVKAGRIPAVRQRFASRETVPSWSGSQVTIRYEVRRDKAGDGLEVVRTSRGPLWQWNVAALLFCGATVLGGFWFVRRVFRRAFTKPAT